MPTSYVGPRGHTEENKRTAQGQGSQHSISSRHTLQTANSKQRGVRAVNYQEFGRACTQVFGLVQKCNAEFNHDEWGYQKGPVHRPHGYDVPTAEVWQERLDARLGIPGKNLQNRDKGEK